MLGLSSLHARAREEGHFTWSAHVHLWVGVLKEPVLITYTKVIQDFFRHEGIKVL